MKYRMVTLLIATMLSLESIAVDMTDAIDKHTDFLISASCASETDRTSIRECLSRNDMEWDCKSKRCMTRAKVVEMRDSANKCAALPEETIEEQTAKKACMSELAKKESELKEVKDNATHHNIAKAAYGFSSALTLINLLSKETSPTCTSRSILRATSIVALAGELYQTIYTRKKIEKLKEEYQDERYQKGMSYETQVKAFEYLQAEQEIIKDIAEKKQTFYTGLSIGYGVAVITSIFELSGTAAPCTPNIPLPNSPAPSPAASAFNMLFPVAVAEVEDFLPAIGGAALVLPLQKIKDGAIAKQLNSSAGVAFVSSVGAMLSYSLYESAKEDYDNTKSNIKKLEEISSAFKSDMAQFCPQATDRSDMNKPECFCYTSKNEKNPDRVNSKLCKDFYAWKEHSYFQKAGNYTPEKITAACADQNGKLDMDCNCKKLINVKTNQNACFKTSAIKNVHLGNLNGAIDVTTTSQYLDSITEGGFGTASLTQSSSLLKNALTTRKLADSVFDQASKKKVNLPPIGDKKQQSLFLAKIKNEELEKKLASASSPRAMLNSSSPMATALEEVQKKLPTNSLSGVEYGTAKPTVKQTKDEYSIPSGQENSMKDRVVELTEEDKKPFDGDIVKDETASIWTVISNRYLTTGYRRLFDTPAEKGSQSDQNPVHTK